MTQEDKELLLKDLCARLPYGVQIHYHWFCESNTIDEDRELDFSDVETLKYNIENPQNNWCEISWKPYLCPMLSMTDEEKEEVKPLFSKFTDEFGKRVLVVRQNKMALYQDWLNAHHFDYRGLIPKGLALEAPEGMYNINKK